jgi:hypothetical protein
MAMKLCLENEEIERQLIFDSDSDCCTEDEDNDWGYEDEDDEQLVQPSSSSLSSSSLSSPSSWGQPQQHGMRGVNNFCGGAVWINLNQAPHVNEVSTPLCVFMLSQEFFICWWERLTDIITNISTALKTDLLHSLT